MNIKLEKPIAYKKLFINDSWEVDIKKYFDECSKFVEESKKTNGNCLIHCREGKSRSVSILISYGIKVLKKSLKEAYEEVNTKTNGRIRINDGFKRQLMEYELIINQDLKENTLNFFPKRKRVQNYNNIDNGIDYYNDCDYQIPKRKKRKITKRKVKKNMKLEINEIKNLPFKNKNNKDKKTQLTLFDLFKKKLNEKIEKIEKIEKSENDKNIETFSTIKNEGLLIKDDSTLIKKDMKSQKVENSSKLLENEKNMKKKTKQLSISSFFTKKI
jgi:hypothetical protein